ncbi:MAG: DUF4278 domain-containing protein [Xenococcus sp. (in: cyanobacteria)]
MQLTYRGIKYSHKSSTTQNPQVECLHKYRLSAKDDSNKVSWIRPITYFTYRGVSYTKRPLSNAKTRLLQ